MSNSITKLINMIENLNTIKQVLENIDTNDLDNSRIQLISLIEDSREGLLDV